MAKRGRPKGGRPKIKIDWESFEKLCALQCTLIEIADYFNCSEDTIENKCKEHYKMRFSDIFRLKRGKGKVSLRRTQMALAQTSPAMAIFLGKNYLNQSDKQEIEHNTRVRIIRDSIQKPK